MNDSSWHNILLCNIELKLRPIYTTDWELIYKWCNDPDVLYYSDGPNVTGYDIDTIKNAIFKPASRDKFCFIIETNGQIIGECWLQQMNLDRILPQHLSQDCRRIDLSIGEKMYWGKGNGTKAIKLLMDFGFSTENVDMIFGCDIESYNERSLKAFQRNGFEIHTEFQHDDSSVTYDVCLTKEKYQLITKDCK